MGKNTKFNLNSRSGRVLVGALAFVATYIVSLRAIDTGSLWQYGLTIGLFIYGINRLISAIRRK